jgi:hypothetical protein
MKQPKRRKVTKKKKPSEKDSPKKLTMLPRRRNLTK